MRRLPGATALAALCVMLASCASEPVPMPPALEYQPAPRSTLVTRRDLDFLVAKWQGGGEATTVLARRQEGAAPRPVARLLHLRRGATAFVAVQVLPEHGAAADRVGDEIATLEQLYSLVLRQDPQARYCLGSGRWPCDATREGTSHAQLLQALAGRREQSALRAPAAVPWQVVEMQPAPPRTWDADVVGVRAVSAHGPLGNIAIHFDRAPHSICTARSGGDGVAVCRLQDQHADGHEHDHASSVVATFPGDVRPDRVLLPTTHVLSGGVVGTRPVFARPLPLPAARP